LRPYIIKIWGRAPSVIVLTMRMGLAAQLPQAINRQSSFFPQN
jgi:hypothetical protein